MNTDKIPNLYIHCSCKELNIKQIPPSIVQRYTGCWESLACVGFGRKIPYVGIIQYIDINDYSKKHLYLVKYKYKGIVYNFIVKNEAPLQLLFADNFEERLKNNFFKLDDKELRRILWHL